MKNKGQAKKGHRMKGCADPAYPHVRSAFIRSLLPVTFGLHSVLNALISSIPAIFPCRTSSQLVEQ